MRALASVVCALLAGCGAGAPDRPRSAAAKSEPPPHKPTRYALLINGDSERRHKRNVVEAYNTLRALGFDQTHIFALSPRDSRVRLPKGALRLAPSPEGFSHVAEQLAKLTVRGDLVVVYGTGHGDTDEGDSLLELRRGELWPEDLREAMDRLQGDSVLIMDQCYSGGFADAFEGTSRRTIVIASVDRDHMTDCYYFARTFWSSFLHPERADRNHDGKTSVREAFEAALKAHQKGLAGDRELASSGAYRSFNGFEDTLLN